MKPRPFHIVRPWGALTTYCGRSCVGGAFWANNTAVYLRTLPAAPPVQHGPVPCALCLYAEDRARLLERCVHCGCTARRCDGFKGPHRVKCCPDCQHNRAWAQPVSKAARRAASFLGPQTTPSHTEQAPTCIFLQCQHFNLRPCSVPSEQCQATRLDK